MPRLETKDALSLARPLLGLVILVELAGSGTSWLVAPAVALAAASDYCDGVLARRDGSSSVAGRFLDNICDAVFLGLAFTGFALQSVWSDPVWGSATRYWEYANWLPLYALAVSFGLYMFRSVYCLRRDLPLLPSPRGHAAGVANYVLAMIGALAVWPSVRGHELYGLSRWLLEPGFLTVVLLNASAVGENLRLLFQTGWLDRKMKR